MLDIGSSELLLIVIVAVVFIGPKDLPRALYKLGQIIGKGRAMTRHFRAGIDEMVRQAELEEMQKKWAADNARIMAETEAAMRGSSTSAPDDAHAMLPSPGVEDTPPAYQDDPAHMTPPASPAGDAEPASAPATAPAPTPRHEDGAAA